MKRTAYVRAFAQELAFEESEWPLRPGTERHSAGNLRLEARSEEDADELTLTNAGDAPASLSFGCRFTFPGWRRDDYLMIPAAAYGGNRFTLRKMGYPPIPALPEDMTPDCPPLIADIPHLSAEGGASEIRLRAGDCSFPCVCVWQRREARAVILTFPVGQPIENGVTVREDPAAGTLTVDFSAPALRLGGMYRFPEISTAVPTEDRPMTLGPGAERSLRVDVHAFSCESVEALYARLFDLLWAPEVPVSPHELPLSEAHRLIAQKHDRDNWFPQGGFYSVGMRDGMYGYWQAGWVGGAICTYPLWLEGNAQTRERCDRNLDFLFEKAQAPKGLFYGIGDGERFYGDHFQRHGDVAFHLLRKSADVLYFASAQLLLRRKEGRPVPETWRNGVRLCCGAFEEIWNRHRRLGQFVDLRANRILSGSTSSAGIAPAGLCLAAMLLEEPRYTALAEEIAQMLAESFLARGFSCGGPGEILSAPDSESAYGMLESFTLLYEATGKRHWLEQALQAAYQYASWVMPYDYPFPAGSEFGRHGLRSAGSVWANAQNKHSAPGACTHSASALYRLYLYTMDARLLNVIRATAHNITQYLSREDRPIRDYEGHPLPSGWMCERVSTSDWEGKDKIGGVFANPCWCEISAMMSYCDLPGLVVDLGKRALYALDHLQADWAGDACVTIRNPCAFPATFWVHAHSGQAQPPSLRHPRESFFSVALAPGESVSTVVR